MFFISCGNIKCPLLLGQPIEFPKNTVANRPIDSEVHTHDQIKGDRIQNVIICLELMSVILEIAFASSTKSVNI